MKIIGKWSLLMITIGLTVSCSLEKRLYRSGYYIQTNEDRNQLARPSTMSNHPFANEAIVASEQILVPTNGPSEELSVSGGKNYENTIVVESYQGQLNIGPTEPVVRLSSVSPSDTLKIRKLNNNLLATEEYGLPEDAPQVTGFAVAALVLGILSLFTTLIGAMICGTLAIIFGLIALYKIRREPDKWKGGGMAWAGYICAVVSILLWGLIL